MARRRSVKAKAADFHFGGLFYAVWVVLVRADAGGTGRLLRMSELYAGAALRLAGFSSGTGVGGRESLAAGRCGSIAVFCIQFSPVLHSLRRASAKAGIVCV